MLTPTDLEILDAYNPWILANWWCKLNSWEWPKRLPDPEEAKYIPDGRRHELMQEIMRRVGHKAISREWNSGSFAPRMTDEEHDDFYQGTFCGDEQALHRHRVRMGWETEVAPDAIVVGK
jgi:hypothetical protein